MGLWSKKSIALLVSEADHAEGPKLKRTLTATNLTLLGIGAIIGAGIFVLTGQAAAQYAGPAIVLSFVIAALGCLFAGLCYAEFASMIPISGSAYTYAYATLGEFFAWIIGWDLILEYLFASSTVAVGWSGYFTELVGQLGFHIPREFTSAPIAVEGTHDLVPNILCVDRVTNALVHGVCDPAVHHQVQAIFNVPALLLVAAVSTLLVIGIKESAAANNLAVFVKLAVVLLVIGAGFFFVKTSNWSPFIPPNSGKYGEFGWSGIVRGSGVIFFAYIGFDAVSTAAQEAKNPQRDLPIGMLGSLAICTVLYILMALVMTGLAKYTELGVPHPVFVAINAAGPGLRWLTYLINIAAIAGLASVVLVMLMGQPRIFFSMARDGLLPKFFGKVHPKFQTPYIATIITGIVAGLVSGLFPIGLLGELVSIGTLLAFVLVSLGIIVLRVQKPELERPFRTPFVPLVPILSVLVCGYMMASLPSDTWIRLIVWMVAGLVIYFAYGRHHSKFDSEESTASKN